MEFQFFKKTLFEVLHINKQIELHTLAFFWIEI